MSLRILSAGEVRRLLPYEACIPLMREAMTALSEGRTRQLPRAIIDLNGGRAFGTMPGALAKDGAFGAKLVSVYPENFDQGKPSHQGAILLFDPATGAPMALIEAGEVTAIRTAAMSAAATDALARADARRLAILGYGEQAWRHVEAIARMRPIERVAIWGRSQERAKAFAEKVRSMGMEAAAYGDPASAVAEADIICTVTAAPNPFLDSAMVRDGTHINAVGSSRAEQAEIAGDLVRRARFFADYRPHVLAQGAEFMRARRDGLVDDNHILGEIGDVFNGRVPGRVSQSDVTLYKSLGHITQDLHAATYVLEAAKSAGAGAQVEFVGPATAERSERRSC